MPDDIQFSRERFKPLGASLVKTFTVTNERQIPPAHFSPNTKVELDKRDSASNQVAPTGSLRCGTIALRFNIGKDICGRRIRAV